MVRKGSLGRSCLSKDQKNVRGSLREDTWGSQKSNCKEEPRDGNMPDASGKQQGGQHGWSRAPGAATEPCGPLWGPTLASLSAVAGSHWRAVIQREMTWHSGTDSLWQLPWETGRKQRTGARLEMGFSVLYPKTPLYKLRKKFH